MIVTPGAPQQPVETFYAAPVYESIVVVNPPERHEHRRDHLQPRPQPAQPPPPPPQPKAIPVPAAGTAPPGIPRGEHAQHSEHRAPAPANPAPSGSGDSSKPIPRGPGDARQPERGNPK